jgi:hypothetical protein
MTTTAVMLMIAMTIADVHLAVRQSQPSVMTTAPKMITPTPFGNSPTRYARSASDDVAYACMAIENVTNSPAPNASGPMIQHKATGMTRQRNLGVVTRVSMLGGGRYGFSSSDTGPPNVGTAHPTSPPPYPAPPRTPSAEYRPGRSISSASCLPSAWPIASASA